MRSTILKVAAGALLSVAAGWYVPDALNALQSVHAQEQAEPRAQAQRRADQDEERILPKTAEGKTAVGIVFGAFIWFMVYTVQRFNRRSKAEGDLDTRLPLILQSVTGGWEKLIERQGLMIDAAEGRAAKATEEREALMNRFIDYATTQQTVHDAKIEALQKTNAETYDRMDRRLNDCLSRDKIRDDKVEAIDRKILQLDQKQFQAALVSAPMVGPVTAPVVAAPSTVSMQVPPGGLTVSPSAPG